MKINFNILDQEIDLTIALTQNKEWWFNNCNPKIPIETKVEDLTNEQKILLVQLAIYEGHLSEETLYNLPNNLFIINN
jgi:hypothetical protein